nr:efflux transporter outer membrane subunit [Sphingomicrobium nitratireducens]
MIASASLLALSACAGHPDPSPTPDQVAVPETFVMAPGNRAASEHELAALLPDDPAFVLLASRTLDEGPDLAGAMARIEMARAIASRARAERMPSVGYNAGVEGRRINPDMFGADVANLVKFDRELVGYGANLSADWDADLFGRLKASQRAAAYRVDAASADAAAMRVALIAEVAAAVIDWRTIEAQGRALAEDARGAEELGRLARIREAAGLTPGIASERAAAQAAASRARVAAIAGQQALLTGRLVALTALPADEVVAIMGDGALPDELAGPPPALPSTLVARRPDIAASAARLAAADAEVAAAAAARFPRLNLKAGIGLLAFALGDLFETGSIVGNLGAGLAGPLLDFGRIASEIDRAEAATRLAFEDYRKTVFTAFGEAEACYGLVAATDMEAEASHQQAAAALHAARLTRTRMDAGLATLSEALEQQRLADAGQAEAAAARGRAQRARIRLWQALGGGPLPRD